MHDSATFRDAFVGFEGVVGDAWIDANGHMNVGWYDHVFDTSESTLFAAVGIDEAYIRRTRHGMFRVEKMIRYEREALRGDRLHVEGRISFFNGKAIRQVHDLINETSGTRAARARYTSLHVSLDNRKVAPVADPRVAGMLRELARAHDFGARRGGPGDG